MSATPVGLDQAVVLSSALPPITAKVASKIKSGQYVPMKDLLADNMSLWNQLEALPGPHYVCSGLPKPRLREIQSPLTWVLCFLAYIAVRTPDPQTRDLLTYARLVVREAQRHGGPGWLEYDKIFRQHAALDSTVKWNELNPSLHASTVMTYRAGHSQCYSLCHEPDHDTYACALLGLQAQPPPLPSSHWPGSRSTSLPQHGGPVRKITRPETLERICVSWNRGRCSFAACSFRHICATCKQKGHRARDCQETPADAQYKSASSSAPKPSRAQGEATTRTPVCRPTLATIPSAPMTLHSHNTCS